MERATLKIEIPFTDHAHCIGRQGNQIQSIMSTTDTHIHFPDGNREPNGAKSNQVPSSMKATIDFEMTVVIDIVGIDHRESNIDSTSSTIHQRDLAHVIEISCSIEPSIGHDP
jgi:hypothetical protein